MLVAASIYLVKYLSKQRHLLPFYNTGQVKRYWHYKYMIKMVSNNKLKEIRIKNCTCYYFHGVIKFEDFDIDNILIDE